MSVVLRGIADRDLRIKFSPIQLRLENLVLIVEIYNCSFVRFRVSLFDFVCICVILVRMDTFCCFCSIFR